MKKMKKFLNKKSKVLKLDSLNENWEKSNNFKTILLIGRSGRGKSTLANVMAGVENKFEESSGSVSETRKIQVEQFENKNANYLVIDAPGIGDTKMSDSEI